MTTNPESEPSSDSTTDANTKLQQLLVQRMLEALDNPETATPGVMQAALRYLHQNQVTSLPVTGSAHAELAKRMENVPFKLTGTE